MPIHGNVTAARGAIPEGMSGVDYRASQIWVSATP
jgi:hypothetical protein